MKAFSSLLRRDSSGQRQGLWATNEEEKEKGVAVAGEGEALECLRVIDAKHGAGASQPLGKRPRAAAKSQVRLGGRFSGEFTQTATTPFKYHYVAASHAAISC